MPTMAGSTSRRWPTGTGWASSPGGWRPRRGRCLVQTWVGVCAVAVVACTPSETDDDATATATSPADKECSLGPVEEDGGVAGEAVNGEFWVLAPGEEMLTVGRDIKVVFRLTGSGPAAAFIVSPDGERVELTGRLQPHTGSNFDRPGEEWGAFFEPDEPGCWELIVERGDTTGVLPLPITAT